jgi:hypothetical protein
MGRWNARISRRAFRGVLTPDDISILVAAFDKAWEAVQASGAVFGKTEADLARAILAKHIIAAAKNGERDQTRLRDDALMALAQSNLRTSLVRRRKAAPQYKQTNKNVPAEELRSVGPGGFAIFPTVWQE